MADLKISQLTDATTPLAGTEVVPIVQSGVTKKVSVADLTAGRDVSVAKLTAMDNVVIGTAGKGIDFSADPSQAGMTSQLLDDYEEGTFTPSLLGGTTTTYTTQTGRYTIIGRQVFFQCEIQINSLGDGSNNSFVLSGLPSNAGNFSTISIGFFASIATSVVSLFGYINANATSVTVQNLTSANTSSSTDPTFGNGARIIASGHYSI